MRAAAPSFVLTLLMPALALAGPPSAPVRAAATTALEALKTKNDRVLAKLAHPKKGVRFSTYGQVSRSDVRLWPAGLRGAFQGKGTRVWGTFDGSGHPMRLTFTGFRDFVWKCDYAATPHVRENPASPPESSGNQGGNAAEAYRGAVVVEYFCPSDDTRMWSSLSLAFERAGTRWYLVGVVHDGWTI